MAGSHVVDVLEKDHLELPDRVTAWLSGDPDGPGG